ncbi:MAG: hypothetical protein KAT15_11870, partial [Bacteroidales bacterium]|nr:hypothetical protein [Bacteroidales bacterium]
MKYCYCLNYAFRCLLTPAIPLFMLSSGMLSAQYGSPTNPDFSVYEKKIAWEVPAELVERLSSRRPNNFDEARVPDYTLPGIFTTESGKKISNTADWEKIRRAELLDLFRSEVYGYAP